MVDATGSYANPELFQMMEGLLACSSKAEAMASRTRDENSSTPRQQGAYVTKLIFPALQQLSVYQARNAENGARNFPCQKICKYQHFTSSVACLNECGNP